MTWVAGVASGLTVALLGWLLLPGTVSLASRVRPYVAAARERGGGSWAGPAVERPRRRALRELLDRSHLYGHVEPALRLSAFRTRQLGWATALGATLGAAASAVGARPLVVVVVALAGALGGAARPRAAVDRAITERREAIRAELPTVNQVLAVRLQVGAGLVLALTEMSRTVDGIVVHELAQALAAHRAGRPLPAALEGVAATTVESEAARLYRLLASGVRHGTDLAEALRSLAEDVREAFVADLRRSATRRRAATLVPLIGILAPVMLLFIAAPLPWLVLGAR